MKIFSLFLFLPTVNKTLQHLWLRHLHLNKTLPSPNGLKIIPSPLKKQQHLAATTGCISVCRGLVHPQPEIHCSHLNVGIVCMVFLSFSRLQHPHSFVPKYVSHSLLPMSGCWPPAEWIHCLGCSKDSQYNNADDVDWSSWVPPLWEQNRSVCMRNTLFLKQWDANGIAVLLWIWMSAHVIWKISRFRPGWSCFWLRHCKMAHKFQEHDTTHSIQNSIDLFSLEQKTKAANEHVCLSKESAQGLQSSRYRHMLRGCVQTLVSYQQLHFNPPPPFPPLLWLWSYRPEREGVRSSHVTSCSHRLIFSDDLRHRRSVAGLAGCSVAGVSFQGKKKKKTR